MRRPITCPLTGHLETVEMTQTSVGNVVEGCSWFTSPDRLTCSRQCARLLDLRDRAGRDDATERVLVLYADAVRGRPPADALASALREEGLIVELADADTHGAPPPQDYDGVAIVAPPGRRSYARALTDYLRDHLEALHEMPTWFFASSRDGTASAGHLARRAHELAQTISDDIPGPDRST
ncbi:MAG: hypothetical protein ABJE66_00020 [Deltaproteobacteria bacterium]